jgi:hypothetical protein
MKIYLPEFVWRAEEIQTNTGKWSPDWSTILYNICFKDCLASMLEGKLRWKAAALRHQDSIIFNKQGTSLSQCTGLTTVLFKPLNICPLTGSHKWHIPVVTQMDTKLENKWQ